MKVMTCTAGPFIGSTGRSTVYCRAAAHRGCALLKGTPIMAAMKPRTGDGPMEVTKEGRSLIMRVPIDGGGRLVVELNAEEAGNLKDCLLTVTG
jgi:hypothetical protein